MSERVTGEVKFYVPSKGYGFIACASAGDVFVHVTELKGGVRELSKGARVSFVVADDKKGRGKRAQDVRLV